MWGCKCFQRCLIPSHILITQNNLFVVCECKHGDGAFGSSLSGCCWRSVSFVRLPSPAFPQLWFKLPSFQNGTFLPSLLGYRRPPLLSEVWRLCFILTDHGAIDVSCSSESFRGTVWTEAVGRFLVLKRFSAIRLQPHQHFGTAVWRLTRCLRKKLQHFLLC